MNPSSTFQKSAMRKSTPNKIFNKSASTYLTTFSPKQNTRARKTIFTSKECTQSQIMSSNKTLFFSKDPRFWDQKEVLAFDFCGCENQLTPCEIVEKNLMRNVSLPEMRAEYSTIYSERNILQGKDVKRKMLYETLPKIYPEMYLSHLNNILNLIQQITSSQFCCLAWIQYHTKVEYVTYFLYRDLKKSFKKRIKFIDDIYDQLLKPASAFFIWKKNFLVKGYMETFNIFLSSYYDSIGASVIPLTYYAKFLKFIKIKGKSFLKRFILDFVQYRQGELEEAFRYLQVGQLQSYRQYMRQLNWDNYLQIYEQ